MDFVDAPVRLVVKAPNQKVEDQTIECALGWTVRKLKSYLSEVYPSKPNAEDQKLIYSGQLLHDHLMLKDILRQYDENSTHILHLVCTPNRESPLAFGDATTTTNNAQEPSCPTPHNTTSESSQASTSDGVRHRTSTTSSTCSHTPAPAQQAGVPFSVYANYGASYPMQPVPGSGLSPEQIAQQMLWMQQMYSQYMTQYMQYMQTGVAVPAQANVQIPAPETNPNPVQPLPNQQNAPARPANENVRMNAQGGPVDDDDDEFGPNRDWLDWFYILSRAAVLFSIVYFYSSLSRFLAVTLMAAAFYLYQAGWLHPRPGPRPVQERNQQQPRPEPPEVQAAAANDDNNNRAREEAAPVDDDEQMRRETQEMQNLMDDGVEAVAAPPGPTIFTITWTFISGFFASLIPEQPAQVVN